MTHASILSQYETLAAIMELLLDAARKGNWEYFDELQSRYDSYIVMMKARGPYAPLTGADRERKVVLINRMFAIDREMQVIAESLSV